MLDQKLVDDAIKTFECCSEAGHCDECPIDTESCLRGAPQLGLKAIKELLAENKRLSDILESYAIQYGTATDKEVFLKKERYGTLLHVKDLLEQVIHAELALLSDN